MKVQWLALGALCVLGAICGTDGMSTCKTLDLELVKRKRIEAIRGQILSKLRLNKEPESEGDDGDDIPTELLSVYNSTVEMGKEQAKKQQEVSSTPEQEEEEYFSKQVHKFDVKTPGDNGSKKQLQFNVSEMRAAIGSRQLLSHAELRLQIMSVTLKPDEEQRLELYKGAGNNTRYLGSRFISINSANQWLSFNVTQTVMEWLQGNEETQEFQLSLPCSCGGSTDFRFQISGLTENRGDMKVLAEKLPKSHILVMSIPHEPQSRRKRAAATDEFCTEKECCVQRLYIDFRKDLGWKWIHKPRGYHANYCMGACSYIWNTENKYSQIMALYKYHNPGASAQPCCAPQVLDPLPILYYVGRQHKVEQLSNMIVKTCKCS